MKLHPVISIILGFIIFSILTLIASTLYIAYIDLLSLYFISVLIGGFIATYLAKEMKIQYGIYEGLLIVVMGFYLHFGVLVSLVSSTQIIITNTIYTIILASIGGFIGKMTVKSNRESFNGFSPIYTIVIGLFITYFCNSILNVITGLYYYPVNSVLLFIIVIAVISIVIGGFVTTFFAKEKKLLYGIYFGIIQIMIAILLDNLTHNAIPLNSFSELIVYGIGINAAYLASAVIGGYLGIITFKRLKQNRVN